MAAECKKEDEAQGDTDLGVSNFHHLQSWILVERWVIFQRVEGHENKIEVRMCVRELWDACEPPKYIIKQASIS